MEVNNIIDGLLIEVTKMDNEIIQLKAALKEANDNGCKCEEEK